VAVKWRAFRGPINRNRSIIIIGEFDRQLRTCIVWCTLDAHAFTNIPLDYSLLLSGAPVLSRFGPRPRDLFLFAKHKFVAARRHTPDEAERWLASTRFVMQMIEEFRNYTNKSKTSAAA
jgi:hypothetical protein